jgi:hypothetical protein
MRRIFQALALFGLLLPAHTYAQVPKWQIRGDTTLAPKGCSASAGIEALDALFAAMRLADSVGLERSLARTFVMSTGRFTSTDPFWVGRSHRSVLEYARMRLRHHERLTLQAVTFNGWRGRNLKFGPLYFRRTADDLGSSPLFGIGKGEYVCGEGVHGLNLALRPPARPGSPMRPEQAYPPDSR